MNQLGQDLAAKLKTDLEEAQQALKGASIERTRMRAHIDKLETIRNIVGNLLLAGVLTVQAEDVYTVRVTEAFDELKRLVQER